MVEARLLGTITATAIADASGRSLAVVRRDIREGRVTTTNLLDLSLYIVSHRMRGSFRELAGTAGATGEVPSLAEPAVPDEVPAGAPVPEGPSPVDSAPLARDVVPRPVTTTIPPISAVIPGEAIY